MHTRAPAPAVAAVVRELWDARDEIARERDISPGRVLPDAALVEIAMAAPHARAADLPRGPPAAIAALPAAVARGRRAGRQALPEDDLPALHAAAPTARRRRGPGPTATRWPPPGWRDARAALTAFAEEHAVPVENLCSPDPLRRVLWTRPADRSAEGSRRR